MSRRQKMHEEEARGILAEIARSGLSRAEFCRRRGLSPGAMSWWKWQLTVRDRRHTEGDSRSRGRRPVHVLRPGAEQTRISANPIPLVELRVKRTVPSVTRPHLEVVLAGGRVIRLPPQFDGGDLKRLLDVLESR
jgi:hypothetical protein